MDYARIAAGLVAEIIVLPAGASPADHFHPDIAAGLVALTGGAAPLPGWGWDGVAFAPPAAAAPGTAPLRPLTPRQLRLGLLQAGKSLAVVQAAIDALPLGQRNVAQVEWEYADTYDRDHPLVAQIGAVLGMTAPQMDAAWLVAATL